PEDLADQVHEEQPRLDVGFVFFPVDRHLDEHGPYLPGAPARSRARCSARAVRTRTRSVLYSTDPRRSAVGSAAAAASPAARAITASSSRWPVRAASARGALRGMAPTFVSPMPARAQVPSA